jgi:hypothetical protein
LAADGSAARYGGCAFRDAEGATQTVGASAGLARGEGCAGGADAEHQQSGDNNLDRQSHSPGLSKVILPKVILPKIILPEAISPKLIAMRGFSDFTLSPGNTGADTGKSARSLHKIRASHCTNIVGGRVSNGA